MLRALLSVEAGSTAGFVSVVAGFVSFTGSVVFLFVWA